MEAFINLYPIIFKATCISLNNTNESIHSLSNSFNTLNDSFTKLAELSQQYDG